MTLINDLETTQVDNHIAQFEKTYAEVKANEEIAQRLLADAGTRLNDLFEFAQASHDKQMMKTVNEAWERTQTIAAIVAHQSTVIQGSHKSALILKAQRDQVTSELEKIIKGLYVGNEDVHPAIESFAGSIRGWEDEYLSVIENECVEDLMRERINWCMEKHTLYKDQDALDYAADGIFDLLTDEIIPTEEQKDLLQKLAETFIPKEDV